MTHTHPARSTGWLSLACTLAVAALPALAQAQAAAPAQANEPARLESVVVSATRTPQSPSDTPSSVSLLSLPDLASAQVLDLRSALLDAPGVHVVTSGATGAQSSIFLRGASSHQTLFVVDGVRMNTRSAAYQNYLGGADLAGIHRIEVLRGPQGTLHGSSAMGGVILLETIRGCGDPTGSIQAGAGSFETYQASASVSGGTKRVGYSASLSRLETDNDRPGNHFEQWSSSARLEGTVGDSLLFGATVRSQDGSYEEPGSLLWAAPGKVESENHLVTAYARVRSGDRFSSRLTTAWHRRDYSFADSWGVSTMRNTRRYADLQNTIQVGAKSEIVAGATRELSEYLIGPSSIKDHSTAFYLSALSKPIDGLSVVGGLRRDEVSTFDSANTGRVGASYLVAPLGTTFRATYGTSFTAPGADDRFGVPSWGQRANPGLLAERSRGWDFGISQVLLGGRANLGLTYFDSRYSNLFEWQTVDFTTYEGMIINRAKARTRGVELSADVKLHSTLKLSANYSHLDARDTDSKARLVRRPRHIGGAELHYTPSKDWVLGAGMRFAADRTESGGKMEDYTTVRLFASYQLKHGVFLKLRVENLLDESYEETLGYPALPIGIHGALEWRF